MLLKSNCDIGTLLAATGAFSRIQHPAIINEDWFCGNELAAKWINITKINFVNFT